MTECPNGEIRDLLPDLLHDRLPEPERARVQRHVDACPECADELALLRELRATMRRTPAVNVAAIAAAIPPYRAPARRGWGGWRAAAAIVAVAVGGATIAVIGRENVLTQVALEPVSDPRDSVVINSASPVPPVRPSRDSANAWRITSPIPAAVAGPDALAMSGGELSELSDLELAALVAELETLDALPSEDVEGSDAVAESIPLEESR